MSNTAIPNGSASVMSQRHEALDSLDLFPTPPWATRALLREVLPALAVDTSSLTAWEPASGLAHMSDVLSEAFASVHSSDVHDYGYQDSVGSFIGLGADVAMPPGPIDWVITNPPFNLAEEFALRALEVAEYGVALIVRSNWSEGQDRYKNIFSQHRPSLIVQFSERVPMVKERWDPEAGTATAYSWFIWMRGQTGLTQFDWIRPGAESRNTLFDDRSKFSTRGVSADKADLPLFVGAA